MTAPLRPLLGAHVPTAGGLARAPENGRTIGADAIQIFTRNQRQWKARPVDPDEGAAFRQALGGSGVRRVVAHGSYLLNLASPDDSLRRKSVAALFDDMARCHALGVPFVIVHPGAHLGGGEAAGLVLVARSLDELLDRAGGLDTRVLLEVTAGQGSCVGHRLEHLQDVLGRVGSPERVGVCLDTCHLYAAGYDIATPEGYEETAAAVVRTVGLDAVRAFHLNDAKKGLGSRLDRHASIGEGTLGIEPFRRILNDPRWAGRPMVLETPAGMEGWKKEIALLQGLLAA